MGKRMGKQTVKLQNGAYIKSAASIAGQKEGQGPLKNHFDVILKDGEWGEETWEKTESKMQREAVKIAINKACLTPEDINYVFAGDLLNQCIGAGFAMRELNIPFFGLYGACSTMVESMSLAAMTIDGGFADYAAAVTSSHFCTAERQYRTPLEYGGQRTPTAQWTVTGSGCALLSARGGGPKITHVTTGKIIDFGVKDANNMGGAMAPAALDTLKAHFEDTGRKPDFYDLIVTGDLGTVGREILTEQMSAAGYDISKNYGDCGCMIFNIKEQDVHAGGSGCGCIGITFCGYILELMREGKLKNVLLTATGALLSPTSTLQGESIPSIAHAVAIEAE